MIGFPGIAAEFYSAVDRLHEAMTGMTHALTPQQALHRVLAACDGEALRELCFRLPDVAYKIEAGPDGQTRVETVCRRPPHVDYESLDGATRPAKARALVEAMAAHDRLDHVVKTAETLPAPWRLAPAGPRSVPTPPADFTGREAELDRLVAALEAGRGALIAQAVRGLGGVGKTALARVAAQRVAPLYPDGQIEISLAGASERPLTPGDALAQVARAFDPQARLPDDPDRAALVARETLAGQRVLVLADDARDAEQVRRLVPPPGCALLVTSRHRFALRGMTPLDLEELPQAEAIAYLTGRLEREGRGDCCEEAGLRRLAELCGRLPLALMLAASFLAQSVDWTLEEYLDELGRRRLKRLAVGNESVERVLGLSYEQLEREDSTLAERWTALGVFPPAPFDRAAAAAVWGIAEDEARDALSSLVQRSLVMFNREARTFRLHDLVRLFALARLEDGPADADAVAALQWRHARYYFEEGDEADAMYQRGGDNVMVGLVRFDAAWPHLAAAWAWLAGEVKDEGGGQRDEGEEFDDEASATILDPPSVVGPYPSALAFGAMGGRLRTRPSAEEVLRWLCDLPGRMIYVLLLRLTPRRQIALLETSLAAARALGDRGAEGVHLGNLGLAYADLGEPRRAIAFYEQALVIDREIGDRRGEGADLGALGLAYADLGEPRRAIAFYEQRLAIAREIGDRRGEGAALGALGLAYAALGETRRAIDLYEQWLVIAREIGDRRGEGAALGNLGIAYADLGETRRAIAFYEQQLVIVREIGDRRGEGNALGALGLAYAALGETRRAIDLYEQQLVIVREIGDRRGEGIALGNLGIAYADLGETAKALDYYAQALALAQAIGDRQGAGIHGWNLGLLLDKQGEHGRAAELMQLWVDWATEVGHPDAEKDAQGVAAVRARAAGGSGPR